MPFIQNVSLINAVRGNHKDAGKNGILIQLVDPGMEFPEPSFDFMNVFRFGFLDAEGTEGFDPECYISDAQAKTIVGILESALQNNQNVIVHCVAGINRSGAVAEVGVMMGFDDTGTHRGANMLVKHKMMSVLGWYYTNESA